MENASDNLVSNYEMQFGGFEKLMPRKISEILLVAVPYDSFLVADDERLTELVMGEYFDMHLRYAPKVTRVSTPEEAMRRLENSNFDLVIMMSQIGSFDVGGFARDIKRLRPRLPVVLLTFSNLDIAHLSDEDKQSLDKIFLWLGDPRLFVAITKLIEDELNIEHDIAQGDVQALILIEDSVRFYSSYLPVIYSEIMKQTQSLMAEGVNFAHKMLRMRARPKILLVSDFEQAYGLYKKYRGNLLGVITDVQYSKGGKIDPEAGFKFAEMLHLNDPDIPVLIQSSDSGWEKKATDMGASFINKNSPSILRQFQAFMFAYLGFGDFIFRLENGKEVGRAADLYSMVQMLKTVPAESILYHSSNNHFSKWLMARTEFEIAYSLRPIKNTEFADAEGLRRYLIETLHQFIHNTQMGTIANFDEKFYEGDAPFVKIGSGSIGGKARGLAFINLLLSKNNLSRRFEGVNMTVPNTVVLSTDVFDLFMDQNDLHSFVRQEHTTEEIAERFAAAELPNYVRSDLRVLAERINGPLAVRSSSLLEDSRAQPFAGVYKTYMLPNNHTDPDERARQLGEAIKFVYASVFSEDARAYLRMTAHLQEEEKMAVVIQKVVGKSFDGTHYYPTFSGVAQSYNYYPVPPMEPEDGVSYVALGLGKTIMDGFKSLRFSPKYPHNLHQLSSVKDFLSNSQREFMAVDIKDCGQEMHYDTEPNIVALDLAAAERDGSLGFVGSTYSAENDVVYDGIGRAGARLVTFAPILKDDVFPLADILNFMLSVGREAMGSHVEMEFAVSMKDDGSVIDFYILQMRPMISRQATQKVVLDGIAPEKIACESPRVLGNGVITDIADIVYVKHENFNAEFTKTIAAQIGDINDKLKPEGRRCLLVGPGRWGSSDPWLGIPVKWNQISMSRVIVETALESFAIDPSYGTHFFHNVTSLGIGYFTVSDLKHEGHIDWAWLDSLPAMDETEYVRHVRLPRPLEIRIDGAQGKGVILKA